VKIPLYVVVVDVKTLQAVIVVFVHKVMPLTAGLKDVKVSA
jgi:hypothetical protein